ncbi:unnamed protein product [Ambrosiozyma monospora]|uniref:Unnamed protein product n=1 Tax=Ambrosiozyma monospora TaxID=43982 RepID=A0ACB5TCF9_AMBMO|nr:unnamed protein product [Ambrosiozyma monospora]
MDLLDLRKSGWKAKPAANATSGPKTITEIHAEAERKRQKEEQDTRRLKYEKRQNSSRSNSRWGNSNNDRISSTDLSKVGMIRNSSSSNLGPFSNKRKYNSQASISRKNQASSTHLSDSFTTVSSSSNLRSTSRSASQVKLSERATEPREASINRFAALDLTSEEESEDDDEEEETPAPTPAATPAPVAAPAPIAKPVAAPAADKSVEEEERKKKKGEISEEVQKAVEAKLNQKVEVSEETKAAAALLLDFDDDAD